MNINQILMKFFALPPAVRMILALAGFSGLAAVLFSIAPALRTAQGRRWVLIIGGIGLVIFLIIWGIRRLLTGRKASQLGTALESQGPTRGDIAEQEQLYRDKFRQKLSELKVNGLSIYQLPWFVLVGEPGCGKTASLIHSGLDFPLGKDEVPGFGGTRNYNWWFTNDAVILDTAGRISFHEEGTTDKVEWEYFLKLLKRNRPRCPINGMIIALPADKLLRDSADERAQKASILRERLRQVHQHLGVRFPTFVLVTKMDLVGGFSEFFDEVRADLTQRNQIVGWSRPGEFQEPYDPATFDDAFEQVYDRLRNWGLRYLQRNVPEEELGLIVTFPEGFRELQAPLRDYISTIFQKSPLLEPPFFRGFYFTSAVQEGAPIFDILRRSHAAERMSERPPRAVDSRAFFIHDFYARKVFPEHGLVFRSARHVALNRRARRMVGVVSGVMFTLMLTFFAVGSFGVADLITGPQGDCAKAVKAVETVRAAERTALSDLKQNIELAGRLREHIANYDRPWAGIFARMLFLGASIDTPRSAVERIHARHTLECIFRPILENAETQFAAAKVPGDSARREAYLSALAAYAGWYAEQTGQHELPALDDSAVNRYAQDFEQLVALLTDELEADRTAATEQFRYALESLARADSSARFGTEILPQSGAMPPGRATSALASAIAGVRDDLLRRAALVDSAEDAAVKYWLGLGQQLSQLRAAYDTVLATRAAFAAGQAGAGEQLRDAVGLLDAFDVSQAAPAASGSLAFAYRALSDYLKGNPAPLHDGQLLWPGGLRDLLAAQWSATLDPIRTALDDHVAEADRTKPPQLTVYQGLTDTRKQLGDTFEQQYADLLTRLSIPDAEDAKAALLQLGLIEISEPRGQPPTLALAPSALGPSELFRVYLGELVALAQQQADFAAQLEDLRQWSTLLASFSSAGSVSGRLGTWLASIEASTSREQIIRQSGLEAQSFWRPADLHSLVQAVIDTQINRGRSNLLAAMTNRAQQAASAATMPGIGQLIPGYDSPSDELPFEPVRPAVAARPAEPQTRPDTPPSDPDDLSALLGGGRSEEPPPQDDRRLLETPAGTRALHRYHTRTLLIEAFRAYQTTLNALGDSPDSADARAALREAARRYFLGYTRDWHAAHADARVFLDPQAVALLTQSRDGRLSWPEFQKAVVEGKARMTAELQLRTQSLLRNFVCALLGFSSEREIDRQLRESTLGELLSDLRRDRPDITTLMNNLVSAVGSAQQDARIDELAIQSAEAWARYVDHVRQIGPDALGKVDDPGRSIVEPRLRELFGSRLSLRELSATGPLIELEAHGRVLLRHYLDGRLHELLKGDAGRFPLAASANDTSTDLQLLTRLADQALSADALRELLKRTREFDGSFGKLLAELHQPESDVLRTLSQCDAWIKFLYGDTPALDQPPPPLTVNLGFARDIDSLSAGTAYERFEIGLPLLGRVSNSPAGVIEFAARTGAQDSLPADALAALRGSEFVYRWQLAPPTLEPMPETFARVTQRIEGVRADQFPESAQTAWRLPPKPASLLALLCNPALATRQEDFWIVPMRIALPDHPQEWCGFVVAIKFERPFPGLIPPPPDPGPVPKMSAAERFLTPP